MQTNLVGEMTVLNFKEKTKQSLVGVQGGDGTGLKARKPLKS
jgi:hypothetical protein